MKTGSLKAGIKSLAGSLLYHARFFDLVLKRIGSTRYLVLMYHRILPASEQGRLHQEGMYVTTDTFERHLEFLKRHFRLGSVQDLVGVENPAPERQRPLCILTFDDGWSDFYDYAYPLLQRHEVPALVFLPTDYIGTGRRFWSESLRRLFEGAVTAGRQAELVAMVKRRFPGLPLGEDVAAVLEALTVHLKSCSAEETASLLRSLEGVAVPATPPPDFLTWEQVHEMRASGLVSFGSHSCSHRMLTSLGAGEVRSELSDSRDQLRAHGVVGDEVAFCFPNGNYDDTGVALLSEEGYACAFTTRYGWNPVTADRYRLNRVGLHQDVARSDGLLVYRLLYPLIMRR
ncbi:polysaccharide deacetylase family protein [Geomonas oryzisoli]|uniref:Polysaccharide deacetylase family protein n=1 Tax=Geomonas oryzisoli TaxID=2847992 RepID=A0ABX8J418_9BACT|nr:polysaccharide deacetylase family protein [Geomonas oryzisoli]QWV91841.1 polysaccharide deacetylase family protein [Geomonas oryzisoli]